MSSAGFFDMKEFVLNSNSPLKQSITEGIGRAYIVDPVLLKRSQGREDSYYSEFAEKYGFIDGLTVPSLVENEGQMLPLPLVVALVKDHEARRYYDENPSLQPNIPVLSNDSVFAVGDVNGILHTVINKTDPTRNNGDVKRLSSFFHSHASSGFYLYSVGYNVLTDLSTESLQISSATLQIGRLNRLSYRRIREILKVHLPKTGAFDLGFILTEGIVEWPDSFSAVETVVEKNGEEYHERIIGTRKIKSSEISYRNLQLLAHGFHLPEDN